MNGFDRLKEQIKDQKDVALKQVIEYLVSREDMEPKYLNEEKSVEGMCKFIRSKGNSHSKNGWNFITNEVVYAWAIMYYNLPNDLLGINKININKNNNKSKEKSKIIKNNVVSLDEAKKELENKKQVVQLSLFRR